MKLRTKREATGSELKAVMKQGLSLEMLEKFNTMLAEGVQHEIEVEVDGHESMSSPSTSSSASASRRAAKGLSPPRGVFEEFAKKPRGEKQTPLFSSMYRKKAQDIPKSEVKKMVHKIMHRNARDVTLRSLRLQLQNALEADFSGCDALLQELLDEYHGVGSSNEDDFLAELRRLKAQREAEMPAKPAMPADNGDAGFAFRMSMGLLTNAEKQILKEKSAMHSQRLCRGFLARRQVARIRHEKQSEAAAILIQSSARRRAALRKLRRHHRAAVHIQTMVRKKLAQNRVSTIRSELRRISRARALVRDSSSLAIQRVFRGYLGRRTASRRKERG